MFLAALATFVVSIILLLNFSFDAFSSAHTMVQEGIEVTNLSIEQVRDRKNSFTNAPLSNLQMNQGAAQLR